MSQDFYREELDRTALGHADLEAFLTADWELAFSAQCATDLYAQMKTWSAADISGGGDLGVALRRISARVLLMPSETDLYFRVADNAAELPYLRSAELRPIPSIWGHRAGNPRANHEDQAFLRDSVREWLSS